MKLNEVLKKFPKRDTERLDSWLVRVYYQYGVTQMLFHREIDRKRGAYAYMSDLGII